MRASAQKIVDQFGSLGSGNHFCEVCLDERDRVWVVLHSGSRGIGKELAERHIKTAKLVAQEERQRLEDKNLAWLTGRAPEFDAYVADMLWAQRYAWENRNQMIDAALAALRRVVHTSMEVDADQLPPQLRRPRRATAAGGLDHPQGCHPGGRRRPRGHPGIHGGELVHRPGTGNPLSYESCSHGAGRRLGRKQAKNQLTGASLRTAMAGRAWDEAMAAELVDEHPEAYKDIHQVMVDQADLVEVVHELHQVLNLKGT